MGLIRKDGAFFFVGVESLPPSDLGQLRYHFAVTSLSLRYPGSETLSSATRRSNRAVTSSGWETALFQQKEGSGMTLSVPRGVRLRRPSAGLQSQFFI